MPDKKLTTADIKRGGGVQLSTDATSPNGTAATLPPRKERDTNWINRGAQWRPEHYQQLKVLAAQRGLQFRQVLASAVAEYIERQEVSE